MDFGSPVAQNVDVSPSRGLTTLSDLIGLKQAQQNLQTGALVQQQEQGQAQLQQETMNERQKLQSYMQSLNGKYDPNSVADWAKTNLPLIGNEVAQSIIKTQSDKQALAGSLADLNQKYRQGLSGVVSGFIGTPATSDQVNGALDEYVRENPQAAAANHWAQNLIDHIDKAPDQTTRDHLLSTLSSTLAGAPQQEAGSIDTGGTVQPGAVNKFGLGFQPEGASVKKTLPPQIIQQPGTGAPAVVGGGAGTTPQPIGANAPAGQTNWWQPAPGQAQKLAADTSNLAVRAQNGNELANNSPQALDALNRARAILDRGKWTGSTFSLFKELQNGLAGIGIDTSRATDTNELVKNLARYEATRASGVGNTDAARALFETGSPNTKVDAQAAKNIVTQAMGNELALQGYARIVNGPDPQAAMQKEQAFRSIPNLVEAYEYGLMRSPQEADQFLQRYNLSKDAIAKARAQLRALGAL